jgi:hypothetical protein
VAKDIIGSLRKFTLDGISFRVAADANVKRKPFKLENSMIPTSGKSIRQSKHVVPTAEGFDLILNAEEAEVLKGLIEGGDVLKVSYTTADGSVYRCTGQVSMDGHETETGKASLTVHPDDDWTVFIG